ncbi:MAG: hypothetical protein M1827_003358 [Pycnora praestabilis]|nr:MAG: hypothetical protein M1827_003358 [Pycnora praestabilis]
MRVKELLPAVLGLALDLVSVTSAASPPVLTSIFTATILLGAPLGPIPIPGGILIIEPILGGSITGPVINGTILGGLAYPPVYNNDTLQVPQITVYGKTNDGFAFLVEESGIGTNSQQVTRLQITVGGPYAALSDEFVLADVTANANRTVITVDGFAATHP